MSGYLTTHVLDTAKGCPAEGIRITLYRLSDAGREEIAQAVTNDDGRTDTPICLKANSRQAAMSWFLRLEITSEIAGKSLRIFCFWTPCPSALA